MILITVKHRHVFRVCVMDLRRSLSCCVLTHHSPSLMLSAVNSPHKNSKQRFVKCWLYNGSAGLKRAFTLWRVKIHINPL
jgi:hypothetical protein